jgi:hypothetical protein
MKAKRIDTGVIYELNEAYYKLYASDFELIKGEKEEEKETPKVTVEVEVPPVVEEKIPVEPKKMRRPKK